jgi:hypothetical protein
VHAFDVFTTSCGAVATCLEGSDHAAVAGLTKGDALAAANSFSIAFSAAVRAIDEHSARMASQNALRLACERHAAVIKDVWCQADRERCAAAAFVDQSAAATDSASKLDTNGDAADKTPATRLLGTTDASAEPSTDQLVKPPKTAGPPSPPAPPSGTGEGEPAPPPVKRAREDIYCAPSLASARTTGHATGGDCDTRMPTVESVIADATRTTGKTANGTMDADDDDDFDYGEDTGTQSVVGDAFGRGTLAAHGNDGGGGIDGGGCGELDDALMLDAGAIINGVDDGGDGDGDGGGDASDCAGR